MCCVIDFYFSGWHRLGFTYTDGAHWEAAFFQWEWSCCCGSCISREEQPGATHSKCQCSPKPLWAATIQTAELALRQTQQEIKCIIKRISCFSKRWRCAHTWAAQSQWSWDTHGRFGLALVSRHVQNGEVGFSQRALRIVRCKGITLQMISIPC